MFKVDVFKEEEEQTKRFIHRLLVSFMFDEDMEKTEQAINEKFQKLKLFFQLEEEEEERKSNKRRKVEKSEKKKTALYGLMELSTFISNIIGQNETIKSEQASSVSLLLSLGDLLCEVLIDSQEKKQEENKVAILTALLRFKYVRSSLKKTSLKWPLEDFHLAWMA